MLRWETKGVHAHEMWYKSSEVAEIYPAALEAWGQNEQQRRRQWVWDNGGTHEEECVPQDSHLQSDDTWHQVCEGYSKLMWDLYMECIKSDRTRNPKFMIRMPEVCFWRWVHWCDGDVWLKLVVKFVTTEEVAMQDGGVSVNHGDGAPLQQGMVLAPGQSLNVSDLPSGPAQSNDPIAQQSAASMELVSNAPAERPRNRVFKQVYQVHWSDIASAK